MSRSQFCFDKTIFWKTMLAASVAMTGYMFKNGGSEYDASKHGLTDKIGIVLLILGMSGVSYMVGWQNNTFKTLNRQGFLVVGACISIIISSIFLDKEKAESKVSNFTSAIIVAAWIVLGYSVGIGKSKLSMFLGIQTSLLVLLSVFLILPWQKKKKIISGFGMVFLAIGCVSFAMANAVA